MSITDKVKAAMTMKGKKNSELAEYLGITSQSLSNKFNRGSFSAEDLIKIAEFTESKLLLEFDASNKISFGINDLRK